MCPDVSMAHIFFRPRLPCALGLLSAQSIAVLGYIEPAVSVLVSTLILGEPLSLAGWIGAALIIGAAALSEVVE